MDFTFDHIRKTLVGLVEAQATGPGISGNKKRNLPLNFQGSGLKRFLEALHNLANGTPKSSAFHGNGEALIIMQTSPATEDTPETIGCSFTQGLFNFTFLLPSPKETLESIKTAMPDHFLAYAPKMTKVNETSEGADDNKTDSGAPKKATRKSRKTT